MKQIPRRFARPPFAKGGLGGISRRVVPLALIAVLLAACGTVPKRAPDTQSAGGRPGGYYLDDGPGANPPANLDAIADATPRVEPLHRFANNPYVAFGQRYVPLREPGAYRERGVASWYGRRYHSQRTASGETYDMYAMTAAHPVLPIPSYARVTSVASGASVIVRINDRGPFRSGRVIDLSYAAAWKLGFAKNGSALVEVEAVTPSDMPLPASRRAAPEPTALPVAAAVQSAPVDGAAIPVTSEGGGIYLQLGAFSARENAENFRARVRDQLAWLDRAIEVLQKGGLFRLQLGPYRSRAEADGIAARIRDSLDLQAVFVAR